MIIGCADCHCVVESGDVHGLTPPERLAWNRREKDSEADELREALRDFASQKTYAEMDEEMRDYASFEDAHEFMILKARTALKNTEPKE